MKPFKFFSRHIAIAHDGGFIFAGEHFYTMNKEERQSLVNPNSIIPKYHIMPRWVHPKNKDKFKPDYEKLWYFNCLSNALEYKMIEELNDWNISQNILKKDERI
jgi:hypothetical protein